MNTDKRWFNILVNVCRAVVAPVFILSGFVKAVDPIGTQYKINEYVEAVGLVGYVPDFLTLLMSVAMATLEFSLGVFMLFAIHRRGAARLLLLVMAVMTPITLWLALANPISDCGCFGDAVKLTNWQTLGKNVVLLAAAVIIYCRPDGMTRFLSRANQWIVSNYTVAFILAVAGYSLYTLPEFDFRPYHIGANIKKGMEIPPGAPQPEFQTTFILRKNGVEKEFTIDNYPDSTWTFVDSKTIQTREGYVPPIHDFSILRRTDETDITDSVLSRKGYTFLLISPHLEQADDSRFDLINQIYDYALDHGYPFYCLTASGDTGVKRWIEQTGADYPFCTTDATTLQTMIRSNPGLILLKDGTVIGKWSHNRLPDETQLKGRLENLPIGHLPADQTARKIVYVLLWFVLPLTLLTIADRLWAWSKWVRNKEYSIKHITTSTLKNKNENEKENRSRQLEDEPEPARGCSSGKGAQRDTDSREA